MNLISYLNKELSEKSEENLELISLICSIADSTIDIAKDTRVTGLKLNLFYLLPPMVSISFPNNGDANEDASKLLSKNSNRLDIYIFENFL